jgi:hypothetical protein
MTETTDRTPCTDPWDPAYDEEFARSGLIRHDITVLPPARFVDEAMPERRKRELLGASYEASVRAGGRNSPTVRGRFGQVCCGWPKPPTPGELYDAIRATEPDRRQRAVFTTWLCESEKWELLKAWADGMHTLRELVTAMYRHGWETSPKSQFLNNFAQPPTEAADATKTR